MRTDELIQLAFLAAKQSYSPYSNYRVGAALLTESGEIFTGCNIENASYPVGICAERTAAAKAVAAGERGFEAIAIIAYAESDGPSRANYAFPCGMCRQFLNEFALPGMQVYVAQSESDYREYTLEELLPESFGPAQLGKGEDDG